MEIKVGTITFGGDEYKLAPNISGLESSAIRTGSGLYAGIDGGYVSSQLYGHRTITFQGFILGNCEDVDASRRKLISNLKIRTAYPIGITTFSGENYATAGYVTDLKSSITGPRACEFQITLLCPDPVIYEADENNPLTPKWTQLSLTEQGYTNIENTGTATVYPVITITPASTQTQSQVSNMTSGNVFYLQGYTAGQAETIVVDMERRTAMRGDTNLSALRTIESRWWGLEPGNNNIACWTGGPTGSTATIRYKTGYQGI